MQGGERVQLLGEHVLRDRLLPTVHEVQIPGVMVPAHGQAGVELVGPPEPTLRLLPVVLPVEVDCGQDEVGLGQVGIQVEGPLGGLPCPGPDFSGGHGAVSEREVPQRQTRVCPGVGRVAVHGVVQQVEPPTDGLRRAPVDLPHSPQIRLVRLRIHRIGFRQPARLLRRELDLDLPGDLPGHLSVHGEDVPDRRGEGLRPAQTLLRHRLDQADVHAHRVAAADHRGLHHVFHVQLGRDLR